MVHSLLDEGYDERNITHPLRQNAKSNTTFSLLPGFDTASTASYHAIRTKAKNAAHGSQVTGGKVPCVSVSEHTQHLHTIRQTNKCKQTISMGEPSDVHSTWFQSNCSSVRPPRLSEVTSPVVVEDTGRLPEPMAGRASLGSDRVDDEAILHN